MSSNAVAQERSFQGLGDVPGGPFFSAPYAISADGSTVVGESYDGTQFFRVAFRWTREGGIESLGRLPAPFDYESRAWAVSADGSVVVGEGTNLGSEGYPTESFIWTRESGIVSLHGVEAPGVLRGSVARAVSPDGMSVVGRSELVFGEAWAARWTLEAGWETLAGLPMSFSTATAASADGRVVTGWVLGPGGGTAFKWAEADGYEDLGDLPGGVQWCEPLAISGDGSVIVGRSCSVNNGNSATRFEAFRWTAEEGLVGLGDFPGGIFNSAADAVSRDGRRTYGRGTPGGAMMWDELHGMRALQPILAGGFGLDLTGWSLASVQGVSADGRTLVGMGSHEGFGLEGWIAYLGPPCAADFNDDGASDSQDFFEYLIKFFAGRPAADVNGDGEVTSDDFFDYLAAFFAGC